MSGNNNNNPVSGDFNLAGSKITDPDTNVTGGFGPGAGVGLDAGARGATQNQQNQQSQQIPSQGGAVDGSFNLTGNQIDDPRDNVSTFGPGSGGGLAEGEQRAMKSQPIPSQGGAVDGSFNLTGNQIDDPRDNVSGGMGPGSGLGLESGDRRNN